MCIQGVDFSAVILTVKAEGVANIPFEEYFMNHCGVGALVRLEIVDVELLGDSGSDLGFFWSSLSWAADPQRC
ncbi:hypothetical protein C2845_PM05G04640 [Panicum miliaceum]|uniref:Uncharacterized protein n=1 Tax=Panicum miliaceum TaxID=4540 RepID=A0A3L6SWJ8_PANMI|nr:hypothetical protein C2845_PM05G04640 [Panicum miliaceum]